MGFSGKEDMFPCRIEGMISFSGTLTAASWPRDWISLALSSREGLTGLRRTKQNDTVHILTQGEYRTSNGLENAWTAR